jgi:anti-sigma factor RsiW
MDNQLTFDDLQAYQAGQLTGPARYRVERLLLENPFYADALAGLEAMQKTATGTTIAPASEQLADLHNALHQRIHESANRKRLWPLWIATTTAAILFMLAMAIYFIYFAPKHPVKSKPVNHVKTVQHSQIKTTLGLPKTTIYRAA